MSGLQAYNHTAAANAIPERPPFQRHPWFGCSTPRVRGEPVGDGDAPADPDLSLDVVHVDVHGALVDAELFADFPAGESLRNQHRDFSLTTGEEVTGGGRHAARGRFA